MIAERQSIIRGNGIKRTAVLDDVGQITHPGSYITKVNILSIYDAMTEAIRTGVRYRTRLDPPTDSEGNVITASHWDSANWQANLQTPRGVK